MDLLRLVCCCLSVWALTKLPLVRLAVKSPPRPSWILPTPCLNPPGAVSNPSQRLPSESHGRHPQGATKLFFRRKNEEIRRNKDQMRKTITSTWFLRLKNPDLDILVRKMTHRFNTWLICICMYWSFFIDRGRKEEGIDRLIYIMMTPSYFRE